MCSCVCCAKKTAAAPTSSSPVRIYLSLRIGRMQQKGSASSSYWCTSIPWYPEGCFGPYRHPSIGYTRRELLADGIVHGVGILGGIACTVHICTSMNPTVPKGLVDGIHVYCLSALLMLCCSAVFNGFAWSKQHLRLLQLADHTGILCLICGSYTPMMVTAGAHQLLALNWTAACFSFTVKALGSRLDSVWLHVPLFVLMGWSVVSIWDEFWSFFSDWAKQRSVVAGLLYTGGLLPWGFNRLEGHNALWHVFVLAGSAAFYSVVLLELSQRG